MTWIVKSLICNKLVDISIKRGGGGGGRVIHRNQLYFKICETGAIGRVSPSHTLVRKINPKLTLKSFLLPRTSPVRLKKKRKIIKLVNKKYCDAVHYINKKSDISEALGHFTANVIISKATGSF